SDLSARLADDDTVFELYVSSPGRAFGIASVEQQDRRPIRALLFPISPAPHLSAGVGGRLVRRLAERRDQSICRHSGMDRIEDRRRDGVNFRAAAAGAASNQEDHGREQGSASTELNPTPC